MKVKQWWSTKNNWLPLRLVFTSNGVVVRVVIRKVERYDLVKIKLTESEAEHWFCLCLCCLRSSENCIVEVASRSGRINQWQCSILDFVIGWFFRFCFQLRQSSFHWIISDRVLNGIRRNGNVPILPTPIPSSLGLRLRLPFSISLDHKLSYDSNSDSDSVASENQPWQNTVYMSHDVNPSLGPSGVWEKHFPLISYHLASEKSPLHYDVYFSFFFQERASYLEYQKVMREVEHLSRLYIAHQFVMAEVIWSMQYVVKLKIILTLISINHSICVC